MFECKLSMSFFKMSLFIVNLQGSLVTENTGTF